VYAHDLDAGEKRRSAAAQLERMWDEQAGTLSVQVLQEFFVNATAQAREVLRLYRAWVRQDTSADTVLRATEIAELARLSF